jgi:hypothetical protein
MPGEEFERLKELIGCEECPIFGELPDWANEPIQPQIGMRVEETEENPPRVDIVCEGTDKMAKGKGICVSKFENEKTIDIELG